MPGTEGGLGTALVGEKIAIGRIVVNVSKLIGEGTSFVFLLCHVSWFCSVDVYGKIDTLTHSCRFVNVFVVVGLG